MKERTLALACVVVLPFLRFLIRNEYPVWRVESLAAAGVLLAVCAGMAWLARGRMVFLGLVAGCSVLMSTVPVIRLLAGVVELTPGQAALWLGAGLGGLALLMRERFAALVVVYTVSVFAVDLGMAAVEHWRKPLRVEAAGAGEAPAHVLYVVLDEHIGLAGFPDGIEECASARAVLESTLAKWKFRVYPRAYSNYPSTVTSLSSLLNRRVLARRRAMLDENSQEWRWGTRTLRENRLLRTFGERGYRVEVAQHRAINHLAKGVRADGVMEYWDELGALELAPGGWWMRFRWLVGNYQQSDLVAQQARAFFPFRFAPHTTGPLAARTVWPEAWVEQVVRQPRKTLFLAHLITPHRPFLYRRDGAVRQLEVWSGDRVDRRVDEQAYGDHYRRYCEQVEYVSGQLEGVLRRLEESGRLERATVVVHGDHGSRIRRVLPGHEEAGRAAGSDPERWDYAGEPPVRDRLDRFSTLFAVRRPAGEGAGVDDRAVSLLRALSEELPLGEGVPGGEADAAYLFDGDGRPRAVEMGRVWMERKEAR
ncbi:MAG: sulfatase-like hydrolase/transferase [Bryobacterales bacterium]|nr:sulfatase-like hydrolase/transferase [Bryobacterales bacterium]